MHRAVSGSPTMRVLLCVCLMTGVAAAQTVDGGAPVDGGTAVDGGASAGGGAPVASTTKPPKDEFNFDLSLPGAKRPAPPSDAERKRLDRLESRVRLRRTMLRWHQGFGFATLLSLLATDVIGTLLWADKFGGGGDTGRYNNWHLGLSIGTSALFQTTAFLALFAPNPYPKPIKFDAAFVHKASMALAAACFVAQLIMGPLSSVNDGKLFQKNMALAHVVIGWSAFGFMTIGTTAYLVK